MKVKTIIYALNIGEAIIWCPYIIDWNTSRSKDWIHILYLLFISLAHKYDSAIDEMDATALECTL